MEVELMVTKRDDDRRRQPGEYRAICLWKAGRQSFAIQVQVLGGPQVIFMFLCPFWSPWSPWDGRDARQNLTYRDLNNFFSHSRSRIL